LLSPVISARVGAHHACTFMPDLTRKPLVITARSNSACTTFASALLVLRSVLFGRWTLFG
jgi:hypothetical protein